MTIIGACADGARGFVWADSAVLRSRHHYLVGHVYKIEINRAAGMAVAGAGTRSSNGLLAQACREARSFDLFLTMMPLIFRRWYKLNHLDGDRWIFAAAGYSEQMRATIAAAFVSPGVDAADVSAGFASPTCGPVPPARCAADVVPFARNQLDILRREFPLVRGEVITAAQVSRGAASMIAFDAAGAELRALPRMPAMSAPEAESVFDLRLVGCSDHQESAE
jgi:hypothetical protein